MTIQQLGILDFIRIQRLIWETEQLLYDRRVKALDGRVRRFVADTQVKEVSSLEGST